MGLLAAIRRLLGIDSPGGSDTSTDSGQSRSEADGGAGASRSDASGSASVSRSLSMSAAALPDADERDFELEKQDDSAGFDFERDIARWFTAEFRIEQAWSNLPRRQQLFRAYGVRDVAHWYQVQATFERWLASPVGKARYPSDAELSRARMTTTQSVTVDELEAIVAAARAKREG